MNKDRSAKANQGGGLLQKYCHECGLVWMDEVGLGDGRRKGGGGSICVEVLRGWAGWILRCTEVRNLVYEISVTQFQCARGHDRSEPAA